MSSTEVSPINKVKQLLYRRFQVTLVDGRVLIGDFQCLDKQGNLILGNTTELVHTTSSKPGERHVGIVLVPLAQQQKVEVQATISEKMSLLSVVDPVC